MISGSSTMRRGLLMLLMPLLLTACGSAWWLDKTSFPEDRALGRAAIADLIAGNQAAFAARLPEAVRPQVATQFLPMRRALPANGISGIVLVDAGWLSFKSVGGQDYRDARLGFEIVGGQQRALAQMVIRRQAGRALLTSIKVDRIDRPAIEINALRLGDGSSANFSVAVLAITGLALTVAAIRRIWVSGLFRRRWLWIIGCLLGLFRISTIWATSQVYFVPFYVTFFSAGAARQGLGPWTISAGLPVIAIWALMRHRFTRISEQDTLS